MRLGISKGGNDAIRLPKILVLTSFVAHRISMGTNVPRVRGWVELCEGRFWGADVRLLKIPPTAKRLLFVLECSFRKR